MSMAQSQSALHFVPKRVARVRRRGDLRLSRERERELHGVPRPGALDEHVDAAVGKLPGARPVALEGPGSGRRRDAHRDGVLAPAGKVELLALEPDRIEGARVRKAPSGLADGEDAVDAKGALRIAAQVVADGVPDASMVDHALRTEHALAHGAPAFLVVVERDFAVALCGGAELRQDFLRSLGRRRGHYDPLRQPAIELARGRRELPGQLGERRHDGGIRWRHLLRGGGERQRFQWSQLRRPREALVQRDRDAFALVHADVDQVVGREGRTTNQPEQVDVLAQLLRAQAQLAGEIGELDAGSSPRGGDDEQQAPEALPLAVPLVGASGFRAGIDRRRWGRLRWGVGGRLQLLLDPLQRRADLLPRGRRRLDPDPVAQREDLRQEPVQVGDAQLPLRRVEDALRDRLAPGREAERDLLRRMVRPLPGLAGADRRVRRVEPFGWLEVGCVRFLRVGLDGGHPVDQEDALVPTRVAPADEPPGTPAKCQAPGIDVALAALAGLSLQSRRRLVVDVDALAPRHRLAQRPELAGPQRVAGADDEQPPSSRAADRVRVAGERDLAQRMLQVLREGEIAVGESCRARRVERGRLFGEQPGIGEEERLPVDAVAAQLALVELLRLDVLDGHPQLQQLRLVALQLPLRRPARPPVLFREELAQLGKRDRLPRVEQERDQVQQPLRLVHQLVLIAGSSNVHWMAATLSPGISTFFPANGPSSVPTTKKLSPSLSILWMPGPIWITVMFGWTGKRR